MKNRVVKKHHQRVQKGFSLIELMVGLTIGLLIVLAVTGSLIFTSNTQRTLSEATELQQQANVVMRIIGSTLRQAGGRELEASPDNKFVFSSTYNGYDASKLDVTGLEGGGANTDTLRISRMDYLDAGGNSADRDCLGNSTVAALKGIRVDNQFSVNAQNLMCLGSGSNIPQAIAVGIEDFQVSYGVASAGAMGTQNMQYFNAGAVADWNKVRAVQVCLRLSTVSTQNAAGGSTVTGCDGVTVAADGRIRKVFRNTFFLRNSLKAI